MIFEFIKKFTDDFKWFPEFLGILAALLLFFKAWRKILKQFFKCIYIWIVFPIKAHDATQKTYEEIQKLQDITKQTAKDVSSLKEIIGFNGGSGLMDQVGYIMGYQSSEFWLRTQPGFICDEDGRNLDCTHGYCLLLGLSSKNDLFGTSWKGYVDKEEYQVYLQEFKDSAKRRESFRGKTEFFDFHNESKGSWVIIAHPISSEKAKTKRYMGFLYPGDAKANKIAESYGWSLIPPL